MSSGYVGNGDGNGGGSSLAPILGQAIGFVGQIAGALLAQHTKRLQDAANENQALDNLIPAFDADLAAVVAAFNSGTSAADCINALYAIDSNAYTYLRAQVGKPGTAWGGPSTQSIGLGINPSYSASCDKKCTAGCCVYLNDLRPAIFGRKGVNSGLIEAIQNGTGQVTVPAIAAPPRSAYGNYSRAAYTLTLSPSVLGGLDAQVLSVSGNGTSFTVAPSAPTGQLSTGGIVDSLTSSKGLTILTVIGGIIIVATALFGQNALRVNR
jgi:hypothetical protein